MALLSKGESHHRRRVACEGFQLSTRLQIPELNAAVPTAAGQHLAVGADRDTIDMATMAHEVGGFPAVV